LDFHNLAQIDVKITNKLGISSETHLRSIHSYVINESKLQTRHFL
jgi:hypothetical protein